MCAIPLLASAELHAKNPPVSNHLPSSQADWDHDGVDDKLEEKIGSDPYLSDTDGDGINDGKEIRNPFRPLDSDGDGRIDVLDPDDDGDGVPSVLEGDKDIDGDGIPNYLDTDSDGDGLMDGAEVALSGKDSDKDHIDDAFDSDYVKGKDENGDGVIDAVKLRDSNNDGLADAWDKKTRLAGNKNKKPFKAGSSGNTAVSLKESKPVQPHSARKHEDVVVKAAMPASHRAKPVSVKAVQPIKMPKNTVAAVASPVEIQAQTAPTENRPSDAEFLKSYYGGTGYFYCLSDGKIVNGIKNFKVTPPNKTKVYRDASEGDYQWKAVEPGIYALQFQLPEGMEIVKGLARGRRIVKKQDVNPLILGSGENAVDKGYLIKTRAGRQYWYTSFEFKEDAPPVMNNNIPVRGGVCGDASPKDIVAISPVSRMR
jgi:hypothetical protein